MADETSLREATRLLMVAHAHLRETLALLPIPIRLANPFVQGSSFQDIQDNLTAAKRLVREVAGIGDDARFHLFSAVLAIIGMIDSTTMMARYGIERLDVIQSHYGTVESNLILAKGLISLDED